MIRFNCPHCGNRIKVQDNAAGKHGKCNNCSKIIDVPNLDTSNVPTTDFDSSAASKTNSKNLKYSSIAVGLLATITFLIWTIATGTNANDTEYITETEHPAVAPEDSETPKQTIDIASVVHPDDYRTYDDSDALPQKVEFNGKTWHYVGVAEGVSGRGQMIPFMYTAGERDRRLVVEMATTDEQVYDKMTYEQKRVSGQFGNRWINHGLRENVLLDGMKDRYSYEDNKLHDMNRTWYPNGQLRKEENYYYDSREGRGRGWYENGNLMYDVVYKDDKEVEGKSFDEDGTEN